jgi:hypothetical protein
MVESVENGAIQSVRDKLRLTQCPFIEGISKNGPFFARIFLKINYT